MTPHPQADILIAIAHGQQMQRKVAMTSPWTESEYPLHDMVNGNELRIKPEIITINGHETPTPVREPLDDGQKYWTPDLRYADNTDSFFWNGGGCDRRRLAVGIIHLTEEAAIAHAEALLSFTRSDK